MPDRMTQLIYVSTARPHLSETEVADIVQASRRNNARREITGLLVFNGMNFMQALEGPEDVLVPTFRAICSDPRHEGVVTIATKALAEREFPDWSMGYERLDPDAPERHQLILIDERLREKLPERVPESTARLFLSFNSLGRNREML